MVIQCVLISFIYNLGLTIKPIKVPHGGYVLVLTTKNRVSSGLTLLLRMLWALRAGVALPVVRPRRRGWLHRVGRAAVRRNG